jgi:PAS domain S-box-containing protein
MATRADQYSPAGAEVGTRGGPGPEATVASFDRIVASLPDTAVLGLDENGFCTFAWGDPEWASRAGIRIEMMVGMRLFDGLAPELAARAYERLRKVFSAGEPQRDEFPIELPGGELWHEITVAPLRGAGGPVTGAVAIVRDVTERKRVELLLRESEDRYHCLAVLAAGAAHDFSNLVLTMLGNAGLARAETEAGSALDERLGDIERAALRARELTRQLRLYAAGGARVVGLVDLSAVTREMAELARGSIPRTVAVDLELGTDVPTIEADATQVRQVVLNLLLNGAEAVGERGGRILLRTAMRRADRALLDAAHLGEGLPEGPYAVLEVRDTGHGIAPEALSRVFDPYYSTKGTGRGLGLTAVLGIVRANHGAIRVESRPGSGTTFEILFPAATE